MVCIMDLQVWIHEFSTIILVRCEFWYEHVCRCVSSIKMNEFFHKFVIHLLR